MKLFLCYILVSYVFFGFFFDVFRRERDPNSIPLWIASPFLFPIFILAYGLLGFARFGKWIRGA